MSGAKRVEREMRAEWNGGDRCTRALWTLRQAKGASDGLTSLSADELLLGERDVDGRSVILQCRLNTRWRCERAC